MPGVQQQRVGMKKENESEAFLRASLNAETARIAWTELKTFFARGKVLHVDDSMDLIDVAVRVAQDDKTAIAHWIENGKIGQVSDETAKKWFECNSSLWTVVVAPWVLVQEKEQAHLE